MARLYVSSKTVSCEKKNSLTQTFAHAKIILKRAFDVRAPLFQLCNVRSHFCTLSVAKWAEIAIFKTFQVGFCGYLAKKNSCLVSIAKKIKKNSMKYEN